MAGTGASGAWRGDACSGARLGDDGLTMASAASSLSLVRGRAAAVAGRPVAAGVAVGAAVPTSVGQPKHLACFLTNND